MLKKDGKFLICNEASSKKRKDVKRLSSVIGFEVYTPQDLTKMLTDIGFKCEYYLDKKEEVLFIATK